MMYWGMQLPPFQFGDTARAGMAVAQIPDLKNWEVSADVGELDRGHLSVGQKVTVRVVALAGKTFPGQVKNLGGTTGPPWDRRFECRIALDQAGPELRPGMTSNMVITVETLEQRALGAFAGPVRKRRPHLRLSRGRPTASCPTTSPWCGAARARPSSPGFKEGDLVAMSNPDQQAKSAVPQQNGAMKALSK